MTMPREPCWACKCGEYDDCECPPGCDCKVCAADKAMTEKLRKRKASEKQETRK